MSTITEILAPLDPHWDRVIRSPMSNQELDDLQSKVGIPIPPPLRDYLAEIGIFQDLTSWGNSAIEVYETTDEFVSARQFLSTLLKAPKVELFPFGGDGAGNEYCLDPEGRIHFVDHDTGKIKPQKEFLEWLESVVKKMLKGIKKRPLNEQKAWNVQFSLPAISFADLVSLLSSVGTAKEIDSDWLNPRTSPAGVKTVERRLEFDGQVLTVSRSEYATWKDPKTSFDFSEPLLYGRERSRIRVLDAMFRQKCPGYKLVDYGPQEMTNKAT